MRIPRFLVTVGAAAALPFLAQAAPPVLNSFGPVPNVAADPPFFSYCTVCHVGAAPDSGLGDVVITGMPERYQPGSTYPVTVTVNDPVASRWGFEAGVTDRSDAQAGAFTSTSPGVSVQSQSGREWVNHNGGGTGQGVTGSFSWTFDWTAPQAGTGVVTLWVAGNAANNAQGSGGDLIYTAARSAVEDGAQQPPVTVALQPDGLFPQRGTTWDAVVRVTNHEATAQTVALAGRLRLPNGAFYPPTGWLGGPAQITLAPGETGTVVFPTAVPANAPLITADYEVLTGVPGVGLYDSVSETITVQP